MYGPVHQGHTASILNANQKYPEMKGIFMSSRTIAAACVALFFCALFAGCTSPTQAEIQPFGTTVATPAPATASPVVTVPATFEPVTPLPANQMVYLELTKDRPTGRITLLCSGGPGMVAAQVIRLRVTLADGSVAEKQITNDNGQIPSGASIVIQGTLHGTDHGEVWVTSSGKIYKVIDQDLFSTNPYS
jgi:hypothetical protein